MNQLLYQYSITFFRSVAESLTASRTTRPVDFVLPFLSAETSFTHLWQLVAILSTRESDRGDAFAVLVEHEQVVCI